MKKIVLTLLISAASCSSFSQTCEEREGKLLEAMGTLSSGFLYNTYGLIGSIADGYGHNVYNETVVTDLMNAQNKLADNLVIFLEKMISENAFKEEKDKNFLAASVDIIKGFKMQVQSFLALVRNNSRKNLDAYNEQRSKSWKDISKLMGIKE